MRDSRNGGGRRRGVILVIASALALAGASGILAVSGQGTQGSESAPAEPPAVPVSVAPVERRDTASWDEFSGRLEAVERVEVRSRVSGAVLSAHFREGTLVREGDLLITIDPDPYAAEVARQKAAVSAAEARASLTGSELERGRQLSGSSYLSQSDLDQRMMSQDVV